MNRGYILIRVFRRNIYHIKNDIVFHIKYVRNLVINQFMGGTTDELKQLDKLYEEVGELSHAYLEETKERIIQEAADVLITLFVFIEEQGIDFKLLEDEYVRKMKINLAKPIRASKDEMIKKE